MTTEELADRISDWEMDHGESFTDYFMHDNIDDKEWGEWLITKGFKERGEAIIEVYDAHAAANEFCCQDQAFLYQVHQFPNYEVSMGWKGIIEYGVIWDCDFETDENMDKEFLLWAEFLLSAPKYTEAVEEFLNDEG